MTTNVIVKAHCASTKEVHVQVAGELVVLQDGESTETYAYDDRVISVREVLKSEVVIKADIARPHVPATAVTMQGILDKIRGVTYTLLPNGRTTICQLTMANGFTIDGKSACVAAANYNQALGEKYAYEDALNNVWPFEDYLLAERLSQ